jgi:hypothetical protein
MSPYETGQAYLAHRCQGANDPRFVVVRITYDGNVDRCYQVSSVEDLSPLDFEYAPGSNDRVYLVLTGN